jgi:hypothetical protein
MVAGPTPVAAADPDFQLTVAPKSVFLPPGGSVDLTIGATPLGGFASPLTLVATGLPAGVTASFSQNPMTIPGTSILTLTAGPGLVATDFNVNVAATGGGITHFALSGASVLDFDLVKTVVEPPPCVGTFQIRLTDRDTTLPIANAFVEIGSLFEGHTDANGVAGPVEHLPGLYEAATDLVGYWSDPVQARIECNKVTSLDASLLPWHPGVVLGKVVTGTPSPTDSKVIIPGTTPVAGATITFEELPSIEGTSAADGTYSATARHLGEDNTPLANVHLMAVADGYWPRSRNHPSPITIGTLAPAPPARELDIALVPQCTARITGQVTFDDSDEPAAGAVVRAGHAHASDDDITDQDGRYAIDAPLGYNNVPVTHLLSAFLPSDPAHPLVYYYEAAEDQVASVGCGDSHAVDFVLPRIAMGQIEGYVRDEDGNAVVGALPGLITNSCRPCLSSGPTDATGYYRIYDIPAPSVWNVKAFDIGSTYWDSPPMSVSVAVGGTTRHDITVVLKKYAQVDGTVRDAITGSLLSNVFIREDVFQGPNTTSAADGTYLLGPIALDGPDNQPRETDIDYDLDGYWPHRESLTVAKDQPPFTRNVDLIPVCRGAVVTGVVQDAVTGAPIPSPRVVTDRFDIAESFADGSYRFENVDVGSRNSPTELTITARKDGYADQTRTIEIFCGARVAVGNPGTIVIDKVTDPPEDPTTFSFDGDLGELSLADGESHRAENLFPGTYDITEAPVTGWRLRDVMCDGEPLELFDDQPVQIEVAAGDTVRCTFTNERLGSIVVAKETNPDGADQAFEFYGPDGEPFTIEDGESVRFDDLPSGQHLVGESPAEGWKVVGVRCDDDDSGVTDPESAPGDVTVELAPGEVVSCTFTNATLPTGTVIIKKETDPDGDTATFDFFGADEEFTLADGQSKEFVDLAAGTHQFSEFLPEGWGLDRIACDDADSGAGDPELDPTTLTVALARDETVTCTFFNRLTPPDTGTIILRKTTEPLDDETVFGFESEDLGPFDVTAGGFTKFTDQVPGIFSISEVTADGWTLASASCDDGSPVEAIDLQAGETVSCTFHNVREQPTGTIVVKKTTDPAGAATSFSFTGDLGAFSLGDAGTHSVSDLTVGTYAVSETAVAGWDLASSSCDDGSAVDAIELAADETVTCTFANVQRGELRIAKVGIGGTGSFGFSTTAPNAQAIASLSTGTTSSPQSLPPGEYAFSEDPVDGWDLADIRCDDGSSERPSTGDVPTRTATFSIEPGESVTCTFANRKRATLTIVKTTDPLTDPQDFAFTTSGSGLEGFSLDTDGVDAALPASRSFVVAPGSYSVTETTSVTGWDFGGVACLSAGGSSTVPPPSATVALATVTLAAGDTVTCTYRNTKRASFAIMKTVNGQRVSGAATFDFQIRQTASPTNAGIVLGAGRADAANGGIVPITPVSGGTSPLLVPPGVYQLCEYILPGWGNPLGSASFVPGLALDSSTDNAFQCLDVTVTAGQALVSSLDNRPPPGGQAKTIGFWKNWASCSQSSGKQKPVLDQTLVLMPSGIPTGKVTVATCPVAVDLLNKSTIGDPIKVGDGKKMASDPAFNFAAQYLAFRLNIAAGANGSCVAANEAAPAGQAILLAIRFDGKTHTAITKANAAHLNEAAALLDRYNNNTLGC